MPTTTRRRVVTVVALFAAIVSLAACMNGDQWNSYDQVNRARTTRGGAILLHDPVAQDKAQAWAERLASGNTLQHSNLSSGMDGGWTKIAENVGYGSSVGSVHDDFMRSSGHRTNILDPSFTHLGVGVAYGHGRTFVVQIFTRR